MQRLNVKLLTILLIAIIVLTTGVVVVHGIQMTRYVGAIPDRVEAVKQEDPRKALELLWRYHQYNPDDADHYADYALLAADCAEQTRRPQDYGAASEALGQLLHRFDDRPEMANKIADRLIQLNFDLGVYVAARDDLRRLKESGHADAKTQVKRDILLARCEIALGNYSDALKVLKTVVGYDDESKKIDESKATGPHELDAYTLFAALLRQKIDDATQQNRIAIADQAIEQLVAANKDTAHAYLLQAEYYRQFDQRDRAKGAIEKAIAIDPENADILLVYAQNQALSNNLKGCGETVDKGIKLYPKDVRFYMLWVNLADLQKDSAESQRRMEEALKALPTSRWLLQMAMERQLQRHDLDGARVTFKKLIDYRMLPQAYSDFLEGKLLAAQGDFQLAAQRLESAKPNLDKQSAAQADSLLMQCYLALNMPDKAKQQAGMLSGTMESEVGLITALAAQGKAAEAIQHYEKIAGTLQSLSDPAQVNAVRKLSSLAMQMYVAQQMAQPKAERDWSKVEAIAAKMQQQGLLQEPQASLVRLDILSRQDNKQKAVDLSKQLLAQYPKEVSAVNAAAILAIQTGKSDEALAILDAAAPELQSNPALLACRMEAVLDSGKPIDAIKQSLAAISDQAEKLTTNSTDEKVRFYTSLGSAYLRLGDRQSAQKQWDKVAELKPDDNHIRLMMFDLARQVGDVPKMKELQAWFAKNTNDLAQNKWMEAVVLLSNIRQSQQAKATAGAVQIELDEADQRNLNDAKNLLLDVANLRPNWVEQPKLMAEVDFYDKKYDDAISELQQAIDLGTPSIDIIKRMITLLHFQHRDEEAGQLLDKYSGMVSNDPELQQTRAEIYVASGDFKNALDLLKDKFKDDSKNFQDHLLHGQLLAHAGSPDQAEAEFRKAADLAPEISAPWLELIRQMILNKKSREALQVLQEAQIKLPEDQRALVMAHGYEMLGEASQAEAYYQNALSAAPDDPLILQQVAMFYSNVNRPADAEKYLSQILKAAENKNANKSVTAWAGRMMAKQLAAKGDYPSFLRAMDLLKTTSDASNPNNVMARIQLLFGRGDANSNREALQLLEQIKDARALSVQERIMLAQLDERVDKWPEARSEMQSVLNQPDADQAAYITFVEMLLRHG
ncbi:MAG TPA: tetratricopeptide repeat protein, partial [Pirellulales bacterium]